MKEARVIAAAHDVTLSVSSLSEVKLKWYVPGNNKIIISLRTDRRACTAVCQLTPIRPFLSYRDILILYLWKQLNYLSNFSWSALCSRNKMKHLFENAIDQQITCILKWFHLQNHNVTGSGLRILESCVRFYM